MNGVRGQNHYELECWIKLGGMVALVSVGGSSGSGRGAAALVLRRIDGEILRDVQLLGAHAPRMGKDHIHSEVLLVATLLRLQEPGKEELEQFSS